MKYRVERSYDFVTWELSSEFERVDEVMIDLRHSARAIYRVRATAEPGDVVPPTVPPAGAASA